MTGSGGEFTVKAHTNMIRYLAFLFDLRIYPQSSIKNRFLTYSCKNLKLGAYTALAGWLWLPTYEGQLFLTDPL
jgi:hypothetical protein